MNKDMARGKHSSNNNLNGNKQGILVKADGSTVLKLILISMHSQLETEERVSESSYDYRGSESPQMHPRVERES